MQMVDVRLSMYQAYQLSKAYPVHVRVSSSVESNSQVRVAMGGVMVRVVSLVRMGEGAGIRHPIHLTEWVWLNPCIKSFN